MRLWSCAGDLRLALLRGIPALPGGANDYTHFGMVSIKNKLRYTKDGRKRLWGQSVLKIASTTRGWKKGGVNSGFSEKGNAGNNAKGGHLEGADGVLPVLGE